MQTFRRLLIAMFLVTTLVVAGCGDDSAGGNVTKQANKSANFSDTYKTDDTWIVYWYLCGTDLETSSGAASNDFQELLNVKLPPNIKFLIMTGGTQQWQNDVVSSDAVEFYLYSSNGLERIGSFEDADMGHVQTLTDFIRYGKENYTADHRVFVFWDHGGGAAAGLCWDERTGNHLSLNDVRNAFSASYEPSNDNPP
ncbi:MAG: clostripain, partial [Selenomonadaceae bacterium]|nr:clostripain [Selenomonadaceae bacterium]